MEGLKQTFAQCKKEGRVSLDETHNYESGESDPDFMQAALVTYFTAGYPTVEECVDIMLGLQAGGSGML